MPFRPTTDEEAAQAITRIVDDTLSESERAGVEAWAVSDPEVMRQIAAQRSVAQSLERAGPPAPEHLIASIDQRFAARGRGRRAPEQTTKPARRDTRRRLSGGWLPTVAIGAVAALALIVVVATGTGGSGASPNVSAAARLAFAPASASAPRAASARFLDVSYGGVTFPNYGRLDVVATGRLVNRIDGRPALTVFYRLRDGARLSYTVFSGGTVPFPASARLVRFDGVALRVYRMHDGLSVVTLVRSGRTCVLAARTVEDAVLGLAERPLADSA